MTSSSRLKVSYTLLKDQAREANSVKHYLALLIPNGFPNGIEKSFRGHMRFFIFIILARVLIDQLKLSLTARIILESTGIDYIATIVLIMGLLSLARDQQIRKQQRTGNPQFSPLCQRSGEIL